MSTSTSTTAETELVGGSGGSGGGVVSDIVPGSSRPGELTRCRWEEEIKDMAANCLILLAKGRIQKPSAAAALTAEVTAEGNYKCQTCSRSFPSFQALGGHRASHKKLVYKPERAVDESSPFSSHGESTKLTLQIPSGMSGCLRNKTNIRVHGCSICRAEFSSGQALGGHMRRHRPLPEAAVGSHGESRDQAKRPRTILSLDLNLPAPEDNHHENKKGNMFSFVGF